MAPVLTKRRDLNKLVPFLLVAQSMSLTRAAGILKMPKSRVSRAIKALEKEMGVTLFLRSTRQVRLTQEGARLKSQIEEPLGVITRAFDFEESIRSKLTGRFRITAPEDVAIEILPQALGEIRKSYPEVTFEIIVTNEFVDLIKDGVDYALRVGHLKDSNLRARKIADVRSLLFVDRKARHLLKTQSIETLDGSETLSFLPLEKNGYWQVVRHKNERRDVKKLKISPRFASSNVFLITQLTQKGFGVALLPEFMGVKAQLEVLSNEWSTTSVPISLVTSHQNQSSPKYQLLAELLFKELQKVFASCDRT